MLLFQNTGLSLQEQHSLFPRASPTAAISAQDWTHFFVTSYSTTLSYLLRDQQQTSIWYIAVAHHSSTPEKEDTSGFNTSLISAREKRGIMSPKGWETAEPEEAAAPAHLPTTLKRARKAAGTEQETSL